MLGINKVILIGNLGKDPELKYTPSGKPVCSFSIATTEQWGSKENRQSKTEWHNIVIWGKLAEVANQYLEKGKTVYLEGKITTRSWDNTNGGKSYKTEIVCSTMQFMSPSGKGGGGSHEYEETSGWEDTQY